MHQFAFGQARSVKVGRRAYIGVGRQMTKEFAHKAAKRRNTDAGALARRPEHVAVHMAHIGRTHSAKEDSVDLRMGVDNALRLLTQHGVGPIVECVERASEGVFIGASTESFAHEGFVDQRQALVRRALHTLQQSQRTLLVKDTAMETTGMDGLHKHGIVRGRRPVGRGRCWRSVCARTASIGVARKQRHRKPARLHGQSVFPWSHAPFRMRGAKARVARFAGRALVVFGRAICPFFSLFFFGAPFPLLCHRGVCLSASFFFLC